MSNSKPSKPELSKPETSKAESWCPCGDARKKHRHLCGGKLHDDMDKLFATEAGADCTFQLPDGEIKAHKCILSARVEVFERMFSSTCKESETNRVDITDCDFETFKAFLNYVYCGVLHEPFDLYNLLSLSSKYMLPELVCACVPKLKVELNLVRDKVPSERLDFVKKMMKLAQTCNISFLTYLCEEKLLELLNVLMKLRTTRSSEGKTLPPKLNDIPVDLLILSHDLNCTRLKSKCLQFLNDTSSTFRQNNYEELNAYPGLLVQLTK